MAEERNRLWWRFRVFCGNYWISMPDTIKTKTIAQYPVKQVVRATVSQCGKRLRFVTLIELF